MITKALVPTLLFVLFSFTLSAQVGVNTDTPEQALEVVGKIKVGDDALTPTEGTIRYNDPENTFEGYTDGEWEAFNKSATPDRPISVVATVYTTFPNEGYISMEYMRTRGNQPINLDLNGEGDRRVVPGGYFLVIDYIHVVGMDVTEDEQFRVEVAATRGDATDSDDLFNNRVEPLVYVSGSVKAGPARLGNGRAPLLVLNAGQQLTIANQSAAANTGGIRLMCTGFLVTDLDQYYTY